MVGPIHEKSVVLVTGGASGLGRAAVENFHAEGFAVVIMDLPASNGAKLSQSMGDDVRFSPGDVTVVADVALAVQTAQSQGNPRIAVAAAGIGPPAKLFDDDGPGSAEKVRSTFDVNLLGSYNVLAIAGHAMSRNEAVGGDRGVIMLTASVAAFDGQIGHVAYAAAKAGVAGMALPAARELARFGVRVVGVAPGLFDTPLLASMPEKARTSAAAQVPYPSRLGHPREFAALLGHIASNKMLNGEVIRLDGAVRLPPR